jgi:hypothetical protein
LIPILLIAPLVLWPESWAHDKGLQGCEPRGKPRSHITCSRECKECEGMNLDTPKWIPIMGVGVPNGFPNLQSIIARVKTHWLEEFFISLVIYWNVNVSNELASLIWTFETQVMAKGRARSQIASLTPDH